MIPLDTITHFDAFLAERDLRLEAVVIGGAALALLGVISRPTRDCDILHPELSPELLAAARSFATSLREAGEPLDDEWLNNGPASLTRLLPAGWRDRVRPVFQGEAITLFTLERLDLLRTKLFGLCDRGLDIGDCLALSPTAAELAALLPWLQEQDANPGWPAHVAETLATLARRLDHEL